MSEQSTDPAGTRRRISPALLAALVVLVAIAAGVSLLVLPGSANRDQLPRDVSPSPPGGGYEGTLTLPARQAPSIDLRNYLGELVALSSYRGKVVLVTFLYTHCPDVCPLIASNLRMTLNQLGSRAADVRVIAVSVDPRGDTRASVAHFLRVHEMAGRMQYLVGSAAQLSRVWSAWGVGSRREAGRRELIAHDGLVYGVSASGKLTTVYPANFEPSEIVHDVPKLAAG